MFLIEIRPPIVNKDSILCHFYKYQDLNAALDEALENYDIATKWLDKPTGSDAAAVGGDRKPSTEDAKK